MRRVGIIGGMGPEATVLLMQKIIAATPARDDADHVPLIVDQNPQIPSRIRFLLENAGEDPGPVIAGMAASLQAQGAEAIAMPCNTAHYFAPQIRRAITVPFLDMVDLAVEQAAQSSAATDGVAILASPAVRNIKLFDAPLAAHGLRPIWPDRNDRMLAIIRHIKAHGTGDDVIRALAEISAELVETGATLQMIACTELSLIAQALAPDASGFDTLDCLAGAIVKFSATGSDQPVISAP